MRLLLDTQVALWWLTGNKRLTKPIRAVIAESDCYLSVASVWEVAIKHRLGKLPVAPQVFRDEMAAAGATMLPIADMHAIATSGLEISHGDPFDRLLLATARIEHLILLTADATLLAQGGPDVMKAD
ncbi:MAG: type II toxin-antitoxin system VapC family toxin [Candidatus Methylophosphatis roskildensis]